MKIQARRHGYYINGNYYTAWLALLIIAAYGFFSVLRALVKGSVWLCKRIWGHFHPSPVSSDGPEPQARTGDLSAPNYDYFYAKIYSGQYSKSGNSETVSL